MSLADTNFVSRSETCFGGAGAKIKKRQKKDNLKNPFKIIKVGQDDISVPGPFAQQAALGGGILQ